MISLQMNLLIIWWAADTTKNATLQQMAISHLDTMIRDAPKVRHKKVLDRSAACLFSRCRVQKDKSGCVYHLMTYNENTGALISATSTPQVCVYLAVLQLVSIRMMQGMANESTWARGQASCLAWLSSPASFQRRGLALQAWTIYGMTIGYRFTGFQRYLDQASQSARIC
jgi:hypothetical protein